MPAHVTRFGALEHFEKGGVEIIEDDPERVLDRLRCRGGSRALEEEVLGPLVTVTSFSDEAEALDIANGTEHGLGAGMRTRDVSRAHRIAHALRAGMVSVNAYKRVSPLGGVAGSGYGREMGFEATHGYSEPKSIWINVDARLPAWYTRHAAKPA